MYCSKIYCWRFNKTYINMQRIATNYNNNILNKRHTMTPKKASVFFLFIIHTLCPVNAYSSDFVFYCAPWKEINNKKTLQNNFSIKIDNSSLSILGGDLETNFFELIYSHPSFYLFSSPSGVLLNISRESNPRNVTLWQHIDKEQLFYSSTCNK